MAAAGDGRYLAMEKLMEKGAKKIYKIWRDILHFTKQQKRDSLKQLKN